jgi:hypothetical protein
MQQEALAGTQLRQGERLADGTRQTLQQAGDHPGEQRRRSRRGQEGALRADRSGARRGTRVEAVHRMVEGKRHELGERQPALSRDLGDDRVHRRPA